jgi:3-dehydroquinate dehydratase-2
LQIKYGLRINLFQSNIEGELIDKIRNFFRYDGIILNAGAYTHTSIGIGDAVKAITTPVVEVHISNTYARESSDTNPISLVMQRGYSRFGLKVMN